MGRKIEIGRFVIEHDAREDPDLGVGSLAESIRQIGLLQPIAVKEKDGKFVVLGGRRRFRALRDYLQLEELEEGVHFVVVDADDMVAQLVENLKRRDFTPQEVASLVKNIHDRMVARYGKAVRGHRGGWSVEKTANLLGVDKSFVSKMLTIAENEEVTKGARTIDEALNAVDKYRAKTLLKHITRVKVEKAKRIVQQAPDIQPLLDQFVCTDALSFLQRLPDESVDFILTDPPYGIALDEVTSGGDSYDVYQDDTTSVLLMLRDVIPHLYRVLKPDKFVVIWVAWQHARWLYDEMQRAGFGMAPTPLFWYKKGASGRTNYPERCLGNVIDMALYGWKGSSPCLTKRGEPNIFVHPIVRQNRIHVAQRPEKLLVEILRIFSSPGDVVLDCFAGSASTLRACYLTQRRFVGCEVDEDFYNSAVAYTLDFVKKQEARHVSP